MHNEKIIVQKALEAGVGGYGLKNDAILDIVNAVVCVTDGGTFISPKLSPILIDVICRSAQSQLADQPVTYLG